MPDRWIFLRQWRHSQCDGNVGTSHLTSKGHPERPRLPTDNVVVVRTFQCVALQLGFCAVHIVRPSRHQLSGAPVEMRVWLVATVGHVCRLVRQDVFIRDKSLLTPH